MSAHDLDLLPTGAEEAAAAKETLGQEVVRKLSVPLKPTGGLVILKLFESGQGAHLPPGRIVLLGSPLNGSRAAQNLARLPFGKKIMGRGVHEELLTERQRRWTGQRELGVIAGSVGIGLGRLVGVHGAPSDGTVFVEETRLPGILQHLVLRISHTALPFSSVVARQTAAFLNDGSFIR